MSWLSKLNWVKICLFNLMIVAAFGVLMRYKIGFEFPFFEQKNLLLAHSNFALTGWISLLLMYLMIRVVKTQNEDVAIAKFNVILFINFLTALGMMISLAIQGHGIISYVFMVGSLLSNFLFVLLSIKTIFHLKGNESRKWFLAALLFNALSVFGSLFIIYMMINNSLEQEQYLASMYWYLHFQYNGWFFFGSAGLFVNYLQKNNVNLKGEKSIFWMFAISCIPTFGLSVLWLDLPLIIYLFVALMAVLQFYAWLNFLWKAHTTHYLKKSNIDWIGRLLVLSITICLTVKLGLQLGSTIPAISKFAFGFRPIVIAYLHLVFLAIFSVFLLTYIYIEKLLDFGKVAKTGLVLFVIGVLMNELILGLQGLASINYSLVPLANEALIIISVLMLVSIVLMGTAKKRID